MSVNITTYNRSGLLARALNSIVLQDFTSLEVVIADDFSKDDTESIVDSFRDKLKIVYIKHKNNYGNAVARNTALANSKGRFVAFLDDDDEWIDSRKIQKQLDLFSKYNDKIIVCSSVAIVDSELNSRTKSVKRPENLLTHLLVGNGLIFNSTVMLERSTMIEVGGFDERMKKGVDSEFFRRCVVKFGIDVAFLDDVTTAVHEHGAVRMTTISNVKDLDRAISANIRLLAIYNKEYLCHPLCGIKRLMSVSKLLYLRMFGNLDREKYVK